jgi:hypothetical protein
LSVLLIAVALSGMGSEPAARPVGSARAIDGCSCAVKSEAGPIKREFDWHQSTGATEWRSSTRIGTT